MYLSRPSKQQQKKGMEFIKKLIKSQKQVKQMISNSDSLNLQSQTSIQDVLIQSQKVAITKASQPNLHTFNKFSSKDLNKPQIKDHNFIYIPKINRQRIQSQNLSFQSVESQQQSSHRFNKKLVDDRKLNNSLQNLRSLPSINGYSFVKLQQRTQPIVTKSQEQMGTGKLKNFLNNIKVSQSPSKTKQTLVINEKQLRLQQELKVIEGRLMTEKQRIKQIRRDFVELLEEVKRRGNEIDGEMIEVDVKESEREREIERLTEEDSERKEKVTVLSQQVQKLTLLVENEKSSYSSQSQTLKQQILSTQETNSLTTRRIFHLKQKLVQIKQHKSMFRQKQQSNKQLLRQLIRQQDKLNSLKVQKELKLLQDKQQIKERLLDKILAQSKSTIYDQLDKQLNFIKEYYKISSNSRQFKRSINKMTKFDNFANEIKMFQNSSSYSEEIMNMYKRELWDVGMLTFLAEEVMYIEAPQVRKLKTTLKEMDTKKQSLNQILKEKQRLIASLTFKSIKLGEQIEQMRLSQERKRQQEEIASQIDWGF